MLSLVFCWHFHQPDYRDADGRFLLPWTYLHALKDYADMAGHLEAAPHMRCVVNFVPSLVLQLDDYAGQFRSGELRDPILAALVESDFSRLDPAQRRHLVEQCFRLNHPTMLDPFPPYRRLFAVWQAVREGGEGGLDYLSDQYLADLITWYHLAWTGETVRRCEPQLLVLMAQGEGFTLEQRRALFELCGEIVQSLIPRYRALAERGQIELSSTPHSHPILPLLLDFASAREVRPDLPLPEEGAYPGGEARAIEHIAAARTSHLRHFGQAPAGYWPAEGGVSEAAVRLFSLAGVKWLVTGEGVLRHSLSHDGAGEDKANWITTPYRLPLSNTALFFRDDKLSDSIGFEYKNWVATDAVRHFLHELEQLAQRTTNTAPVASIVMDGENAWDYYPYNGYYFLSELFAALAGRSDIETTTYSAFLAAHPQAKKELPHLVAGSWVYGDFTTWMGDAAKNRAWDWLCVAKLAYDQTIKTLPADAAQAAEALLKSCESSDWFWWFGDYNPADAVASFDRVYRQKLKRLYETLRLPPPDYLDQPLCKGGRAAEAGGVMRRGG